MKKIETVFGVLYIEEESDREETWRIKIFDSERRYFDYYNLEYLEEGKTITEFVEETAKWIAKCKSLDSLLEELGINYYTKSEDWTDLLDEMFESARCVDGKWYNAIDGSEITEQTVMENDYVNKVGDVYIFVSDIA